MPLIPNTVYTIRNDLTHTVLDLAPEQGGIVLARGWGWHGRDNQQWKLIGADATTWRLRNQREGRFLSRHDDQTWRLSGVNAANANATFFIEEPIPGRYRILTANNGPGITLATEGVTNVNGGAIPDTDKVLDLYADGAPIAIKARENNNQDPKYRAQLWSFLPVAQLPLEDGTYQIVNSRTETVLDLENGAENAAVQGRENQGADEERWSVKKDLDDDPDGTGDRYTFQSSRGDHFLALPEGEDEAENEMPLHGRLEAEKKYFTVRKDPGTSLYKIFLGGLAVNLATVPSGAPNPAPNTVVSLQAAEAQTWYFV